jgi:opacity protein-like surface antigen
MKKKSLLEKSVFLLAGLALCALVRVPAALAAENTPPQQITFQYGGVIPATSTGSISTNFPTPFTGTSLTDQSTRSGGFQASYSYQFNKWTGADVGYGQFRFTQSYSSDLGSASVQSDLRQGTTDFVFHAPELLSRIHPYAVAGVGALRFMPTGNANNIEGASTETRSAFIYGGGADIDISKRVGIRADYRGFKFKAPDFELAELTTNVQTRISEPSIGVYFRFSQVNFGRKAKSGN